MVCRREDYVLSPPLLGNRRSFYILRILPEMLDLEFLAFVDLFFVADIYHPHNERLSSPRRPYFESLPEQYSLGIGRRHAYDGALCGPTGPMRITGVGLPSNRSSLELKLLFELGMAVAVMGMVVRRTSDCPHEARDAG